MLMNVYSVALSRANIVIAECTVHAFDIYEAHANAELFCGFGIGTTRATIRQL